MDRLRKNLKNSGVAGLASTRRDDRVSAVSAALHGGRRRQPTRARALYLGKSIYRIHGTNQPSTIGSFVSSGCIRLTNADVIDLYTRVQVGTRVVVLKGGPPPSAPPKVL